MVAHTLARITLLAAAGAASLALAADLPPADSLMDLFVSRSGGAGAYMNAKNAEMNGIVEVVGRNITGNVSIVEEGTKSWTSMELPGIGRIEQGYDGDTAWELSALQGPRILEGEEKNTLKRGSSLNLINSWRSDYKSFRTLGSEDVDGKPAWKVEMTPNEGKPEIYDFDKDSGLLAGMKTTVSTPLGDISTEVTLSDYRPVHGLQTPFTMTQKAMGQTIVMQFETILFNAPVPKNRFELPPEIKALLTKRAK